MLFRFEHTEYLYALLAIPVLIAFFVLAWYARKKALDRFGESSLIRQLMPSMSRFKHFTKFGLLMLALSVLIIGWANPQWGTKREKVKRKSIDLFITLDISRSMMAEDIRPNRLERAKQFAQKLVKELKGERIGLIIFAGNAYLQMPLTTDYAAAMLFIKSANPDMAPTQGTAIGEAIELGESSFEEDNKHHKAMVFITDGETHDDETLVQAKKAHENGLLIYTVGVGSPQGGFVPTMVNGRMDYKRTRTGEPVVSKLNESMMRELAEASGGEYFNLIDGDQIIGSLRESINQIEKREFEQRSFSEFESYFQYFIGLALLLLIIEFVTSYRKSKWMEGKDLLNV